MAAFYSILWLILFSLAAQAEVGVGSPEPHSQCHVMHSKKGPPPFWRAWRSPAQIDARSPRRELLFQRASSLPWPTGSWQGIQLGGAYLSGNQLYYALRRQPGPRWLQPFPINNYLFVSGERPSSFIETYMGVTPVRARKSIEVLFPATATLNELTSKLPNWVVNFQDYGQPLAVAAHQHWLGRYDQLFEIPRSHYIEALRRNVILLPGDGRLFIQTRLTKFPGYLLVGRAPIHERFKVKLEFLSQLLATAQTLPESENVVMDLSHALEAMADLHQMAAELTSPSTPISSSLYLRRTTSVINALAGDYRPAIEDEDSPLYAAFRQHWSSLPIRPHLPLRQLAHAVKGSLSRAVKMEPRDKDTLTQKIDQLSRELGDASTPLTYGETLSVANQFVTSVNQ